MSTKVEKVEAQPQEEQVNNQDAEQLQEEEPVDIELQKQMQKITIDESVFEQQSNKQKDKSQKKVSKKKGQDFLDYANKNNIAINLQYGEEDKHHQKRKQYESYTQESQDQQSNMNPRGKYKGNNNMVNSNMNNSMGNPNSKYKNNSYKFNGNQSNSRKGPIKYGGNKFDACNMMSTPYGNPQQQPPQVQMNKEIILSTDEQVLSYIERILSLNTLNRDLYLRYRINDKGMINITELANYYALKNNQIEPQRIIDVLAKNESVASIGVVEDNGIIYIAIKHWNTILPQLNSIEVISAKKKAIKQQQAQYNMQQSQYTPYTYIHMQNNYYLPSQGFYEMPGYANNANPNGNYPMPIQEINKINNA